MHHSKEEDFKRNNALTLYDLYGNNLAQEPCPGGDEIYNFCRPFLGHYNYLLSLSESCFIVEKNMK